MNILRIFVCFGFEIDSLVINFLFVGTEGKVWKLRPTRMTKYGTELSLNRNKKIY